MEINAHKITQEISAWLKHVVKQQGFSDVIVAVSGGIDSAVATTLAVRALGKEHVYAIILPYGNLYPHATTDAKLLINFLNLPKGNIILFNIKNAVDAIMQTAQINNTLRVGNVMARVRMVYLYDLAKKENALVCGTENKSEQLLGYFTRFGDEASDIEPLQTFYKTQVRELAKYLHIPNAIQIKDPTAGLWEGQTDENELGFSYNDADQILYNYFDKKMDQEKIMQRGFTKELVEKVLSCVRTNTFKHTLPIVFRPEN